LWPVIPASPSAQRASGSEPKTLATSGRTSQEQLELFALDFASLKMSKDIFPSDSAKSSETWEQSVTRRRGEYSLRVKSGRLTSASGSSSWPTTAARDYKGESGAGRQERKGNPADTLPNAVAQNWPTISVNESKNSVGKSQLNLNSIPLGTMVAMQQSLVSSAAMSLTTAFSENTAAQTARVNDVANWPTPDASNHRDGAVLRTDNNLEQGGFHGVSLHHAMTKYGQAAPANWSTPNTLDTMPPKSMEGIQRVLTHDGRKNRKSTGNLREDVVQFGLPAPANPSTLGSRQGLWRTPSVAEEKNQNSSTQIYLQNQVGATPKAWATPRSCEHKGHGPNSKQQGLCNQVTQWITPQACHIHALSPEAAKRDMEKGNQITLRHQNPGKLNPRWVETLMGLPVGWTMPSCKSPVTIEPTNYACLGTESSLPPQSELFAF
jgi:hypothetical protein